VTWPLPNVWAGVSVEDQSTADERIPLLLQTPAAVRWVSAEPLLGPVDLRDFDDGLWRRSDACLDWVVVGGESGPSARPIHPDWARSLRDQCAEAGVPFLFKQWGDFYRRGGGKDVRALDGVTHDGYPESFHG
jgi:protein gp37